MLFRIGVTSAEKIVRYSFEIIHAGLTLDPVTGSQCVMTKSIDQARFGTSGCTSENRSVNTPFRRLLSYTLSPSRR